MTAFRSAVFLVGGFVITSFFGVLVPACGLFSHRAALFAARAWARRLVEWAELSCGIRYEVRIEGEMVALDPERRAGS